MSASRPLHPSRAIRTAARPATATLVALSLSLTTFATAASASAGSGSSGASGITSLQGRAQELAAEINTDGQTLDQLGESYDAAQIALAQTRKRQAQLSAQIAASTRQVAAARHVLEQEAILAYLTGGAPIIQRPAQIDDEDLTLAYASIVAGGEKADEDRYKAVLSAQATEEAAMSASARDESVTLADIASDRSQASAALAAEQAALSQVKGQMAQAVAAVEAQQQTDVEDQVESAGPTPGGSAAGPATPSAPSSSGTVPPAPSTVAPAAPTGPTATSPTTSRPTAPPATTPPTTTPPTTDPAPPASSSGSEPVQAPGVSAVLAYAYAQLGKPYQWGGAGPGSFDCSGLVMMAWAQAGIEFPHLAQDQYDMTARIPLSDMIPGDLVFYGTPDDVYHVGIYVGNGNMIDAPETGQDVSIQNIYWSGLLGAGRVTTSS